jgi:hypothetical protein
MDAARPLLSCECVECDSHRGERDALCARIAALTVALTEIGRTAEGATYPNEKARSLVEMWRADMSRYDADERDEVLIRAITMALWRYGAERYAEGAALNTATADG